MDVLVGQRAAQPQRVVDVVVARVPAAAELPDLRLRHDEEDDEDVTAKNRRIDEKSRAAMNLAITRG